MSWQQMQGPFPLSQQEVRRQITEDRPGVLVLGRWDGHGFDIRYVGHADGNLADRLEHWIGAFTHFLFQYTRETDQARELKRSMLSLLGSRKELSASDTTPLSAE